MTTLKIFGFGAFLAIFSTFSFTAYACKDGEPLCEDPQCENRIQKERGEKRKATDYPPKERAIKIQKIDLLEGIAEIIQKPNCAKELERRLKQIVYDQESLNEFGRRYWKDLFKIRDTDGLTVVHWAARRGHLEVLKLFHDTSLLLEPDNNGNTALHWAAEKGRVETVKCLMNTPLLMLENGRGETALHIAARSKGVHIVELLMKTEILTEEDSTGNTALHTAADFGDTEIVRLLQGTALLFMPDHDGDSAIQRAIIEGHMGVVKILLGTPLWGTKDSQGGTILHLAAGEGNAEIIELLMKNPLRFKHLLNMRDDFGNTALHYAAREGWEKVITCLLSYADLEFVRNKEGLSALDLAAQQGHVGVIKILIKTPLLTLPTQQFGHNSLYVALCAEQNAAARVLMDTVLLSFQDINGASALHIAVALENFAMAIEILAKNPKLLSLTTNPEVNFPPKYQIPVNATALSMAMLLPCDDKNKEFQALACILMAFQNRDINFLSQVLKDGYEIVFDILAKHPAFIASDREELTKFVDKIVFDILAKDLAFTPFDREELTKFTDQIINQLSQNEILAKQWQCEFLMGFISPGQKNKYILIAKQWENILDVVKKRLIGRLKDICARSLVTGLSNMGRFYQNRYAKEQGATPANSFPDENSYYETARELMNNNFKISAQAQEDAVCIRWSQISPADRWYTQTPQELIQQNKRK